MLNKPLFKYTCIFLGLFLLLIKFTTAQELDKIKLLPEVNGYIKVMELFSVQDKISENQTLMLLHNRLNFTWYLNNSLSSSVQIRNRLFTGNGVDDQQPFFGESLKQDDGWVDLSAVPINENKTVFHANIDRAWVEYVKDNWNIKAGRQRINWGINLAWNPNDIFNSYNFLDFDYEERPGSDAIKITNYVSDLSFIELAVRMDNCLNEMVIAGKYQINKKGYDVQFLGGKFMKEIVVGAGWAGNIKDAGFKGELSYFHPYTTFANSHGEYSFSTSVDYSFENGWYLSGAYLFNSSANDKLFILATAGLLEQNAKNLYPATHTYSLSAGKQLSTLFAQNTSLVYSPKAKALIILPTFTYSIKNNFDLDFIVQTFFAENPKEFENISNSFYLRLKYSF